MYITGGFTNPLNTDGSTIFLHKLLSNGDMSWEVTMGGPSLEEGQALATDSKGNVYMAGRFSNTVDFDPSINEVNVTSEGGQDIFVQKFNSDGGFLWVRTVGGTSVDQASGIAIDKDDNVYVTGSFERTVDFDPGMGTANLTAIGVEDMFVQKLDSDGNFVWAKQVGGSFVRGRSISTDADGAVYTTGFFRSFTDFDPGAGTFQLNSTGAFDDMFIHKLSADGDFVWAKQLTCSDSEGYGIQIDANNSIYATGFFKGTIDFDPSDKVQTAASNAGSDDIFIVKLNPCSPSAATETVASCGSYTSPSGKLFDASDTYQDTIANTSGCDSVITINLTITSIDTDVNIAGNVLTAATAGATYQWLDCDNGNQPITGETGQSFTATASGNYAVAITENACTDTSDCVNLVVTSVTDNLQAHPLKVFPNPTNGAVHVDFGTITHAAIEVYSIYGQLVFRNGKVSAKVYQFDLDVAAGVYFVKVATEGREMEFKLMKR
ncbi:MAG: SBBP repeat-containing protein [Bacteroidota bacterium]